MESSKIILLILVFIFILILLAILEIQTLFDKFLRKTHKNRWVFLFSFLGAIFIVVALFAPFIFTGIESESKMNIVEKSLGPNEIGDTMGGTMGPFVAIAGVIFTFLAFYIQKTANDEIRIQFKLQQFEAQFYEMLRLHKENVNEIEVISKDIHSISKNKNRKNIKGNLSIFKHNFEIEEPNDNYILRIFKGREAFRIMKNEFEIYYSEAKTIKLNNIREDDFHAAYELFFWGVRGYSRYDKRDLWEKIEPEQFINQLQSKILQVIEQENDQDSLNDFFNHETIKEVFLGNGYSAFLGHYYRHLYHTVKFVVEYPNMDYPSKRNYLKILRGQLSNYEQIMLFYNWMSSYGSSWEDNKNMYFTKYKMIHNLWYSELNLDDFMKQKLNFLVDRYDKLKNVDNEFSLYEKEKELFEGGDTIIKTEYNKL